MTDVGVYFLLSLPLVGAIAMFALGIVVIYQASRVLNLAHGAMAMVPAYVVFELAHRGVPVAAAVPLGIASGAVLGIAVERFFVRPLGRQSPTAQTVGSVAVLGLLLAVAVKVWGTTPRNAVDLFPAGGLHVGASLLRWGQIGLVGVAVLASGALFCVFRFTGVGLAMRSAAVNRRGAALVGIDPDWTARLAWITGGALAGTAGILLAPVTTLHPYSLALLVLPGFVAALIGGLDSLPGALVGASVVGLAQGMVPAIGLIPGIGSFATQVGAPQLVLAVVAFLVMYWRGSGVRATAARDAVAPAVQPARTRAASAARRSSPATSLARLVAMGGLLLWPLMGANFSLLGDASQAAMLTLVAVSVVILTGWVGQISLGQASFVGIGAFITGVVSRRFHVPFPLSLPLAAAVAAGAAALLGTVALRVRGLYLAVATLIFLWMSNEYLFRSSWLVGAGGSSSIGPQRIGNPGRLPFFDLTDRGTFYYVALAAAVTALRSAANLRDSKTGRAFFALRGSEVAAASLGIDVTRYKLAAFAISGLFAGAAGNLMMVGQGAASATQFAFGVSLFYLAIPVVGGLTSLGGAVAASVLFAALNELFFRVRALGGWLDVVGAGLLAVVLLAYPGGLAGLATRLGAVQDGFRRWILAPADRVLERALPILRSRRRSRLPEPAPVSGGAVPLDLAAGPAPAAEREGRRALIELEGITVRFGGLTAVEDVSLSVREGEIVGLIGPNGAGKTTLFNAASGLNVPSAGTVRLMGHDVTRWPVHRRAQLGVGRTFQLIQLFSELSVFENLLVATHLQNHSGALGHLFVTRSALLNEDAARARVTRVVRLLGLQDIADRPVAGLPFGMLRMIEVARAVVTGATLIMLDEPASGLDNHETDRLSELLYFVRSQLGAAILLIEHDVRMVTSVSDYMYVIERGRLLAEGPPHQIQRDERVVAAYLGATPASAR